MKTKKEEWMKERVKKNNGCKETTPPHLKKPKELMNGYNGRK